MNTHLYRLISLQKSLQALLDGGMPRYKRIGLCGYISRIHHYVDFSKWEHYSGNYDFPVPHTTLDAETAWHHTENLWDKRTTYGKLRWEFTEWCLGQITAEIAKIEQENKS